jgi:hypothetical protein
VIKTIKPVTTDANHVVAQFLIFTAVLENDPHTPYPPNTLEEIFANP